MRVDLSDIAGTPGERGRYAVSEFVAPTEGIMCVGPVTGDVTVENTGSLLLVRSRLRATLRLSCTRCLGEFDRALTIQSDEEFATEDTAPDVPTIDREEPEAAAMSDYLLDLSELVRQQILLNLPMASLCRPDCRGICPQCGRNLNEGPCPCAPSVSDSPWDELRNLLRDAAEEE